MKFVRIARQASLSIGIKISVFGHFTFWLVETVDWTRLQLPSIKSQIGRMIFIIIIIYCSDKRRPFCDVQQIDVYENPSESRCFGKRDALLGG